MRKLIIALVTFMSLSSVSMAPIELSPQIEYTKVQVGDRTIFINGDTTSSSTHDLSMLVPKPKTLPKEVHPKFKHKMGILESGGRYDIVNRLGYIGKYQFSRRTLRRLIRKGYLEADKEEIKNFRNDPDLQERAMDALITANLSTLRNYKLAKYVGTDVNGVKITLEGMLAASHLLGPYAVKHYVTTGSLETIYVNGVKVAKQDANGTCITTYLRHFA